MTNEPSMKKQMAAGFPNCNHTYHFLIPKLQEEITLENLDNLPELSLEDNLGKGLTGNTTLAKHEDKFDKNKFVECIANASNPLPISPETYYAKNFVTPSVEPSSQLDTLIIDIHGGGYFCGSPFGQQNFTREWVNNIPNSAAFSIGYRLLPEHKFPAGISDLWNAYSWIILNAKAVFGIDYKKVVLTGDSVGGGLIIIITAMAIQRKFRVPDLIMPIYPVTVQSF